jgi:hypothetical protein
MFGYASNRTDNSKKTMEILMEYQSVLETAPVIVIGLARITDDAGKR